MVVGSLLEPLRRPPDEPGALLEEGRKGAVAVGDEFARVRKSSLVLSKADVDRADVCRFPRGTDSTWKAPNYVASDGSLG
ncbi:MAG: hypothetical protein K0Q96_807 [Rubrobacteraceae bacterium]|nr:hypothetical protein [Rubrobacteraceae bacterium]